MRSSLFSSVRGWWLAFLLVGFLGTGSFGMAQKAPEARRYVPKEGDIVFQPMPEDPVVVTIEGATGSPYSHCGVVLLRGRHWEVAEALGTVHETPLREWIERGREGAFAVYRLKPEFQSRIPEFKSNVLSYLNRPYDSRYEMSDDALYCSELPYKAFQKTTGQSLGQIQPLGSLNWKPYELTIRAIQGGELPLDRQMITPVAVSRARQLDLIYKTGF
jgi:Permuted papain-like amidase enzyme, YaeF/YiiX, C92 family